MTADHTVMVPIHSQQSKCSACKDGVEQPFPFSMAFQPIVDTVAGRTFAFEALVRGTQNESAGTILARLTPENRYAFDQACRVTAITLAARLGLLDNTAKLAINFMPGAVYSPAACIQLTLGTARKLAFPLDRLIFEIVESEEILDRPHISRIVEEYRRHGFQIALDDFGAGYSGLNLLADLSTDIIKLDMDLTRNLHHRPTAMAIVSAMAKLCGSLGIGVVAEGVETADEYHALQSCGIKLMQGYLLAKPAFEALPDFILPREKNAPTLPADELAAQSAAA